MTVKIMMAGDSITAGYDAIALPNGPRQAVYDALTTAALSFDFVGSRTPPSSTVTDNACAAVAGAFTYDIRPIVAADLVTYTPHIVTWLTIANDISNANVSNNRIVGEIDRVLGDARRTHPATVFIVGTATVQTGGGGVPETRRLACNDILRAYVAAHVRLGHRVRLVETADAYTAASLLDNVHPTGAGYTALGNVWAAAILSAAAEYGLT